MTIKHCPKCNSTRITTNIVMENGKRIVAIVCKKCGYCNKRELR